MKAIRKQAWEERTKANNPKKPTIARKSDNPSFDLDDFNKKLIEEYKSDLEK